MDIKLKSNIKLSIFAFVILLLFSFGLTNTLLLKSNLSDRVKKSYFDTDEFSREVEKFINLFSITQLTYEEYIEIYTEDLDDNLTKSYVKNEMEPEKTLFESAEKNFKYYIKEPTGKVYTNLEENESFETVKASSYFIKSFPYHTKGNDPFISVNRFFITNGLTGFIAVPKMDGAHTIIEENMYDYEDTRMQFFTFFGIGAVVLVISLFLGLIIIKKYGKELIQLVEPLKKFYVFPIDIKILIFLVNLLILFGCQPVVFYQAGYRFYYGGSVDLLLYTVFLIAFIIQMLFLFQAFSSSQQIKTEWSKSFVIRAKNNIADSFIVKSSVFKIFFILGLVSFLGIIVGLVLPLIEPVDLLVLVPVGLIPTLAILIYIFSKLAYFNRIVGYSDDIILGRANADLVVKGKDVLSRLAGNLNRMRQGIDYSHKAQLKSERLKTELITNVSHDLRTPLTSIMNYSELLKKEDLSEEKRKEYIDIIEKKSKRLKVLIDDLFEVSKMASGNIELNIEKVDIVQLMNQALGEYGEKINNSSLNFKVSSSSPHIYAMVDGRKMWRVFDNIISNILKYSLENTRVYISIKETDNYVMISFKNISKYELEENIEELLERFKRGDKSRNTEGSGLGLAIAQSIVDNHGGKLEIELDGDLFKTIVTLKK